LTSGIYLIENLINGMKYVGQSQKLEIRISQKHKGSVYLLRAMEFYGKENFFSRILEQCSIDKLDEREIYWVKELKSHVSENGYNISWGGDAPMRDRKHSENTISKMRDGRRKGSNHPLWKKPVSKETKLKQSLSQKGKRTGNKNSQFGKTGVLASFFGKKHTDESKEKVRQSKLEIPRTEDLKRKVSETKILQGRKSKTASSIFHGVRKTIRGKSIRFRTSIKYKGKDVNLGSYILEIDAAKAYDNFVEQNNLSNPLNFGKK